MARSCLFCRIARKEAPASIIYEDNEVMAFLDIRPVQEGHTLVIPKKHQKNIYAISEETVAYLFKIVKKIAWAVKQGVDAQGISIIQNNESAAGQVVFHFHVHIIPRSEKYEGHRSRQISETPQLEEVARKIRQFL